MITVPKFKEVYYNEEETKDGVVFVKTVCDLMCMEDCEAGVDHKTHFKENERMAFGVSRTRGDKYNEQLGKKVAYAMAMRFLFMRLSEGKNVEDKTSFRRIVPQS